MKITKEDHRRYFKEKGDPGFSPKRNKVVIEGTIKKYEANRKRKMQEFTNTLRERTSAVAQYLTSEHGARSDKPVEKYFGKRILAQLRGDEIRNEIMSRLNMVPSNGKKE